MMSSKLEMVFVTLSTTVLFALYCCVDEMRILIRQFLRMGGVAVRYDVGVITVGGDSGGGGVGGGVGGLMDEPRQISKLQPR